MYKITVYQQNTNDTVLEYEGDILPQIGDTYASVAVPDGEGRTVVSRQIVPSCPNYLNVFVEYTYPTIVKKKTKEIPITENY